jgi:hypothetical protein
MDATEATRSEAKACRLNLVSNGANHRQLIDVGSTSLPVSKATTASPVPASRASHILHYHVAVPVGAGCPAYHTMGCSESG